MNLHSGLVRAALIVLATVLVAIGLGNLGRPLANPDEGRYSEISREMAESGDWITPRLNGVKYLEKPPLQYWASALSLGTFGNHEVAARLYVALAGLATLALTALTAARLASPAIGIATALALVASPYFMAMGGIVTLDMGLTLWTTATLCAFLLAHAPGTDDGARRRWMLAAWAAMALAVLSKGLVGIVIPAAALGLHCLLRRDFSVLGRMEWGYGVTLFFAIAAPWFIAVSYANPEFPEFFFIHEHFARFTGNGHRRTEPAWYFVPILFVGVLPWMFMLPSAVAHGWRVDGLGRGFPALRFAILWTTFVVAFFSASGSKLPAYILPAFPAVALVLGRYLADAPARRLAALLAPIPLVAAALGFLAWRAPGNARDAWVGGMYQAAMPWALAGAAALLVAALAGALLLLRGRRWIALCTVAVGVTLTVDCLEKAFERFAPRQSGAIVAAAMRPLLTAETRLYAVEIYDQTLPFYLGRTLRLVRYVDEFETGLRSEPGRALDSLDAFAEEWGRPGDAMAIMQPGLLETFRARGLAMQVLHQDPRRILIRKP